MSSGKNFPGGSSIAIFLLGVVCGVLFGRLLFGLAIAVLVVGAAVWVIYTVRKR